MTDVNPSMLTDSIPTETTESGTTPFSEPTPAPTLDPPKRKRGRPKGSKNKTKANTANTDSITNPTLTGDKRPASPSVRGRRGRSNSLDRVQGTLETLLTTVGVGIGTLGPKFAEDGLVIVGNAESYAKCWRELAEQDARVARALQKLCTGSAWSGVVIGSAFIALPIMSNHGMVPSAIGAQVKSMSGFDVSDVGEGVDIGG